jgi:tetratricopeptide (TPR) repeat protein
MKGGEKMMRWGRGVVIVLAALTALTGPAAAESWAELEKEVGALYLAGRYGDARPLAEELLRRAEDEFGPESEQTGRALGALAGIHEKLGEPARALPLYERALALWEKNLGPDHPYLATPLGRLAELYRKQGQGESAERCYLRLLELKTRQLGPDDGRLAPDLLANITS